MRNAPHITCLHNIHVYTIQWLGGLGWCPVYIQCTPTCMCMRAASFPGLPASSLRRFIASVNCAGMRGGGGGVGDTESSDITIRTINARSVTGSTGKAWNRGYMHMCLCFCPLFWMHEGLLCYDSMLSMHSAIRTVCWIIINSPLESRGIH